MKKITIERKIRLEKNGYVLFSTPHFTVCRRWSVNCQNKLKRFFGTFLIKNFKKSLTN